MSEWPEPDPRVPNFVPPEASHPTVATNRTWPEAPVGRRKGRLGERILPSRVYELRDAAKLMASADYALGPGVKQPDLAGLSHARAAIIRRNTSKRRCAYITRAAEKIYQKLLEDEVRNSSLTCRMMATHMRNLRSYNMAARALIDIVQLTQQQGQSQVRAQPHSFVRSPGVTTGEMDPLEWKRMTDSNLAELPQPQVPPGWDALTAGLSEQSWLCSKDLWAWSPPH
jgi:hypothetical protein